MLSLRRVVPVLRVVLAAALLVTLVLQVLSVPGQFAHLAEQDPHWSPWRWPLTVWSIAVLACGQVVLVGTWKLLGMVSADRIFTPRAFRWVDAITLAMAVAWVLLGALSLAAVLWLDDPGNALALFSVDLAATAVVLLMVVMRSLLHQAAGLRHELDGVI